MEVRIPFLIDIGKQSTKRQVRFTFYDVLRKRKIENERLNSVFRHERDMKVQTVIAGQPIVNALKNFIPSVGEYQGKMFPRPSFVLLLCLVTMVALSSGKPSYSAAKPVNAPSSQAGQSFVIWTTTMVWRTLIAKWLRTSKPKLITWQRSLVKVCWLDCIVLFYISYHHTINLLPEFHFAE